MHINAGIIWEVKLLLCREGEPPTLCIWNSGTRRRRRDTDQRQPPLLKCFGGPFLFAVLCRGLPGDFVQGAVKSPAKPGASDTCRRYPPSRWRSHTLSARRGNSWTATRPLFAPRCAHWTVTHGGQLRRALRYTHAQGVGSGLDITLVYTFGL